MQMLRTYRKCRMTLLIGLLIITCTARAGDGGGVVKAMSVLDGSLHQIHADSSRTVQDSAFFNPAYVGNLDTAYSVQNIVTVKINEASTALLQSSFSVNVTCRIAYTTGSGDTASIVRTFVVKYDTSKVYDGRQSFVFSGARKVTVTVLSVTSNVTSWDPVRALVLENQLITHPKFNFSCSNTISNITLSPSSDTAADELPVSWTTVLGADQYDLEWTYLDTSALKKGLYNVVAGNPSSALDPAKVFLNGSTRVSIAGTSYNIPLMYDDSGTVFIRVRPVQLSPGNKVTAAVWSSEAPVPVLGRFAFKGHQRNLNWQSNISFAEEGKRKVIVHYFDGSLRSRQTVTKDNTTNTTVVGETYYDHQGRPAIEVLPSPTVKSIIQYTAGFNVSINAAEYSQSNFDSLPGMAAFCDIHADQMDSISGAAKYYSQNNPNKTSGMNQFIPNASGYPFKETEYTADNTGRISRQSGVGSDYLLGSGRETKYFYGTPDQDELDALFGTEAGDHSHYFKNMVRDANGQYSVSYVDMQGRTIATALTGNTPSSTAALSSNIPVTVTERLSDSASAFLQGLTMTSQKSLLVSMADSFRFHYSLTPDIFSEQNCKDQPICYTCRYDLEISITDNCHNQLLPDQHAYDTVIHNFRVGGISNSCMDSVMALDFTVLLPEGSYLVTKKLTPSRDAYNYYRDSIYIPGNTCSSLQDYIDNQKSIIAAQNTQCAPDCSTCRANVGSWNAFLVKFINNSGLSYPADTLAYRAEALTAYQTALSACDLLCQDNSTDVDDIRNAMLQDMTPPFGQYADTSKATNVDKYSIFYQVSGDTTYTPTYRLDAINYLNDIGKPDSVFNEKSNLMVEPNSLSIVQFVQNFHSSWAEQLLPYHPEYCKLLAMQAEKASSLWDRKMEAINDYATAYSQGLLNPTGNTTAYPFKNYTPQPGNLDPLFVAHPDLKGTIEARMGIFQKAEGSTPAMSLWALSCMMVKCTTNTLSCINYYANTAPGYDFGSDMCDADKDAAWRNFKQMYLTAKHDLMFQKLIDNPSGCHPTDNRTVRSTPSAEKLFTDYHTPEFSDTKTYLNRSVLQDFAKADGPSDADRATQRMNDSLSSSYDQNCHSYVTRWMDLLSPCKLYDTADLRTVLMPRLYTLCRLACDADHPFGASTLPSGVNYPGASYRSFQDIISDYNSSHGVNDDLHCNPEQITSPLPYDNQAIYSDKPVAGKPSDCECSLITTLYTIYSMSHRDASFSAYLQRTKGVTMSEDDLTQLRSICTATAGSAACNNFSHTIYLPPALQCNSGTTCATCEQIRSMYRSYTGAYPADTPSRYINEDTVQAQRNKLFENYMNNRLGYNKLSYEYLDFLDTCSAHGADTASTIVGVIPKTIATLFDTASSLYFNGIHTARAGDGSYFVCTEAWRQGTVYSIYNGYKGTVFKFSSTGVFQWVKYYADLDNEFNCIKGMPDGGFIICGAARSHTVGRGTDVIVLRADANGNIIWQKNPIFTGMIGWRAYDMVHTHDGGYAVAGNFEDRVTGKIPFALVFKMDSVGNVIWSRGISDSAGKLTGNPGSTDSSWGGILLNNIAEVGDTLLLSGYQQTKFFTLAPVLGLFSKMRESDGTIIHTSYISNTSGTTSLPGYCTLSTINTTPTGYRAAAIIRNSAGHFRHGIVELDFSGSMTDFKQFEALPGNDTTTSTNSFGFTNDGGWLCSQPIASTGNIAWTKYNADGTVAWSTTSVLPGSQSAGQITQNPDSSYTTVGFKGNGYMVYQLSSTGMGGCSDSAYTPITISHPTNLLSYDAGNIIDSSLVVSYSTTVLHDTLTYIDTTRIYCSGGNYYVDYNGPLLCGKASPVLPPVTMTTVSTCTDSTFFAVSKGTVIYNYYTDSLTGSFEKQYFATCLKATSHETFTVTHVKREHHYTLYYYDQAGNLLKTVPPDGVQPITDTNDLKLVKTTRAAGNVMVPAHTLATNYRYNSLNQVVAQYSPDGGTSHFWYDRLGRLAISQNARQKIGNQYSYTIYDSIGRTTQIGQLVSGTMMTNEISRNEVALKAWEDNAASSADQITVTTYDTSSYAVEYEIMPRNLRNRIGWKARYNTASDLLAGLQASATYYSYDILGNIDTVVQDFKLGSMANNANRFKKMVYDYDLLSGKVNKVSYQHGEADGFYHSYLYDAENRVTNVQSSTDSINWDNDAWYSYYAHGPLARKILGEQQVQGINYAYTLQGWIKAVNPDIYTGGSYTLRPDSFSNVVAASVYSLLLNYHDGDYMPISGVAGPDNGVGSALGGSYRPLYNGNVSSMGVKVKGLGNALLYSYQYDQLNRLVAMDAWNRTGAGWNAISPVDDFKERIAYDPNGNIMQYLRNGNHSFANQPLAMDSLGYHYIAGTNKLDHISDAVTSDKYTTDIDGQSSGNYKYDSTGQLISDDASGISNISWTVYGKIASIAKSGDTTIYFTYDASSNRISKSVVHGTDTITTWYVRDAQGSILSVYTYGDPEVQGKDLTQTEVDIYGNGRIGMWKRSINVQLDRPVTSSPMPLLGRGDSVTFTRGNKLFELTNHLGNVLAVISDRRYGMVAAAGDTNVAYYIPDLVSADDYYPFGSLQPYRSYARNGKRYRFGFNGKENDDEVKGAGAQIDYGMRVYDPRIGKFLSVDPLVQKYPELTPYQFGSNTPIEAIDLDGEEAKFGITFGFNLKFEFGVKKDKDLVSPSLDAGLIHTKAQQYVTNYQAGMFAVVPIDHGNESVGANIHLKDRQLNTSVMFNASATVTYNSTNQEATSSISTLSVKLPPIIGQAVSGKSFGATAIATVNLSKGELGVGVQPMNLTTGFQNLTAVTPNANTVQGNGITVLTSNVTDYTYAEGKMKTFEDKKLGNILPIVGQTPEVHSVSDNAPSVKVPAYLRLGDKLSDFVNKKYSISIFHIDVSGQPVKLAITTLVNAAKSAQSSAAATTTATGTTTGTTTNTTPQ